MAPKKTQASSSKLFIAKAVKNIGSQQKESVWKGVNWIQDYKKYSPADFIFAYEESFIIGGVVDRIATSASSGFIFPEKAEKATVDVLSALDLQFVFKNLYITWNCFLEKICNNDGTLVELKPFLTDEVRIKRETKKGEDGKEETTIKYVQNIWSGTPPEFEKEKVVHIKLSSMTSRYYGDSKIWRVLSQVILLGFIDKYYTKLFERGAIKSLILSDKTQKLTDEDKKLIKAAIEDYTKGIDNAFATLILPGELALVADLGKDLDDEAFLKFRDKLIEAISIGTNIPIDVLLSNQSNRNSKTESLEELNRDIAIPLQNIFLRALKGQITDNELKGIGDIKLESIDTKNQTEEMKTITGYVDSGVMTANEARVKIDLPEHEKWNDLRVRGKSETSSGDAEKDDQDEKVEKIEESIKKIYGQYE